MKIAITGGTGFVGRHLARRLLAQGHQVVIISRGVDKRDPSIREGEGISFASVGLSDSLELAKAIRGCDAVAHLGGINREIGSQTYENVHVTGTFNVVEAARAVGAKKVILLSFLRARPDCGSAYHESKFAAEELVRNSGLDYTIFKAGVIYGKGDHMLDHISHALYTFPVFMMVGFEPHPVRPLAVEDLVEVMAKSITEGILPRATVPITGPEEMTLGEAVQRIMRVIKKKPLTFPAPLWVHYAMAWFFERTMTTPLTAKAQVRILSESLAEPLPPCDPLPEELLPKIPFTDEQIRKGLPEKGRFGMKDCIHSQA